MIFLVIELFTVEASTSNTWLRLRTSPHSYVVEKEMARLYVHVVEISMKIKVHQKKIVTYIFNRQLNNGQLGIVCLQVLHNSCMYLMGNAE